MNNGYLCPPFKIIVLDETDSMTEDSQNALRHMMETYYKVARFCFICNYVNKIQTNEDFKLKHSATVIQTTFRVWKESHIQNEA